MKWLAIILIGAVVLFGCIQAPGGAAATQKPLNDVFKEDLTTPTPNATVTPLPTSTTQPGATTSTTNTPKNATTSTPAPDVAIASEGPGSLKPGTGASATQEFSTEMDDNGWYPSAISVKANVPLIIHDKERIENVYFAGAQVNGNVEGLPMEFKVGESKDITFTPTASTCLGNYWPSSGVLKGYLKVNVEGQPEAQC
ncbi:hypothetical protein HY994_02955 [Candidatus Micrarchaeota archaeon]|nr:hypothetical protein [Candidatus Micrarchaeota archaeon]